MAGNVVGETLAMCHTAGDEDGVHIALQSHSHFANGLGCGVAHGTENEHGVEVAVVDAIQDFRH